MAAVAHEMGLPEPRAIVAVCPGEVKPLSEPDLSRIPATTLLAIAANQRRPNRWRLSGSRDLRRGECNSYNT